MGKESEKREDDRGPNQAGLLARNREDEVGVRERQPLIFLNTVPEPEPGHAAGAERDYRLNRLKAGVERIRPGIDKGQDAMQPVGLPPDEDIEGAPKEHPHL